MIYALIYLLDQLVVMILEGENAVLANRKSRVQINPKEADENTIKESGISIDAPVHGSDSLITQKKR